MKKILAALGVIAFLLVLLIKPFEFVEVYSVHAGHVAHTLTTASTEGVTSPAAKSQNNPASPRTVLMELSTASTDVSSFNTGLWLVSLLFIGALTCGCSLNRKRKKRRNLKM